MKKAYHIFCFIFFILLFARCKKPGCFDHGGQPMVITKTISSFDRLVLNDDINVILTQDSVNALKIEAPENIQPNIATVMSGNILSISNNTECRWLRNPGEKINVYLSFKNLEGIDYRGSGNITNKDTLRLDALQIESRTGAGNIELTVNNRYTGSYIYLENAEVILHGKSQSCYTYTNARGKIDFSDFVAKKMVIEYGSLADTYINVTDSLDATIYYKGNLFYKNSPVVTRADYYSSGRLIHEQ
jgi:hypothetical protein